MRDAQVEIARGAGSVAEAQFQRIPALEEPRRRRLVEHAGEEALEGYLPPQASEARLTAAGLLPLGPLALAFFARHLRP